MDSVENLCLVFSPRTMSLALWCQDMIAASVGGGFKLDEIYGNLSVRFSMRVTIERKLFINTSTIVATRGKLMAKSRQPTASLSPTVRAFANRCSLTFVGSTLVMILRSNYSIVLKDRWLNELTCFTGRRTQCPNSCQVEVQTFPLYLIGTFGKTAMTFLLLEARRSPWGL